MREVIMRLTPKEFEECDHAEIVQELVRCKDCKWWDKREESNYGYCHAAKHGYYSKNWEISIYRTYKEDFFCGDGKRKNANRGEEKAMIRAVEAWNERAEPRRGEEAGNG